MCSSSLCGWLMQPHTNERIGHLLDWTEGRCWGENVWVLRKPHEALGRCQEGTIERSLLARAPARTMPARLTHSVGLDTPNSFTAWRVSGSKGFICSALSALRRGSMPADACAMASA